jgi:hypothetical protein
MKIMKIFSPVIMNTNFSRVLCREIKGINRVKMPRENEGKFVLNSSLPPTPNRPNHSYKCIGIINLFVQCLTDSRMNIHFYPIL